MEGGPTTFLFLLSFFKTERVRNFFEYWCLPIFELKTPFDSDFDRLYCRGTFRFGWIKCKILFLAIIRVYRHGFAPWIEQFSAAVSVDHVVKVIVCGGFRNFSALSYWNSGLRHQFFLIF